MNLPAPWRSIVVDLSHHQGSVDFTQVAAAGVLGVVHKATQGTRYVDDRFAPRRELARSRGLLYGGYHFGTTGDVDGQVRSFLAQLRPEDLAVLDVERNPGAPASMTLAEAERFVLAVRDARGAFPVVYGGGDYLRDVLRPGPDSVLGVCPLWWASYTSVALRPDRLPACWRGADLWQHTEGVHGFEPHVLAGVGPCDRDAWGRSDEELRAFWRRA